MERLGDKLKQTHIKIRHARENADVHEHTWVAFARKCKYSQLGGDGYECAYIGEGSSDDPFCYSDNCPIVQDIIDYNPIIV